MEKSASFSNVIEETEQNRGVEPNKFLGLIRRTLKKSMSKMRISKGGTVWFDIESHGEDRELTKIMESAAAYRVQARKRSAPEIAREIRLSKNLKSKQVA